MNSEKQRHDGGLARARLADDGRRLAGGDAERDVLQRQRLAGCIAKRDVPELDRCLDRSCRTIALAEEGPVREAQEVIDVVDASGESVQSDLGLQQFTCRALEAVEERQEGHQFGDADICRLRDENERADEDCDGDLGDGARGRPKHVELQEPPAHTIRCPQEAVALVIFLGEGTDELQRVDAFPHPETELLVLLDHGLAGFVGAARGEANPCGHEDQAGQRKEGQLGRNQEHQHDEDDECTGADHQAIGEAQPLTDLPRVVGDGGGDIGPLVLDPVVDARAYRLVEDPRAQTVCDEAVYVACHPGVHQMNGVLQQYAGAQQPDQESGQVLVRDRRKNPVEHRLPSAGTGRRSSQAPDEGDEQEEPSALQERRGKPEPDDRRPRPGRYRCETEEALQARKQGNGRRHRSISRKRGRKSSCLLPRRRTAALAQRGISLALQ